MPRAGHQDRLQRGRAQRGRARGGDRGARGARRPRRGRRPARLARRDHPAGQRQAGVGQRLPRRLGHRRCAGGGRGRRRHRAGHRRVARRRTGRVVARLGPERVGRTRGRGRRRPRDRVRAAGHGRELRVPRRDHRPALPGLPDRRGRRGRLVGDHEAPGHGRARLGRHGHGAAALRDRRARVPRPGRHHALRHHRAGAGRRAPRRDQRGAGEPAARHAEGGPQRRRRLPQHDDARAHRPGRRGQGRAGRGAAVRGARRPRALRRRRRAAAAVRPAGRADQRPGRRAPAHHREGPRPAEGGPGVLERDDGAGARRLRGLPHHHAADHRVRVRRLPPRRRAARGRGRRPSSCPGASGA